MENNNDKPGKLQIIGGLGVGVNDGKEFKHFWDDSESEKPKLIIIPENMDNEVLSKAIRLANQDENVHIVNHRYNDDFQKEKTYHIDTETDTENIDEPIIPINKPRRKIGIAGSYVLVSTMLAMDHRLMKQDYVAKSNGSLAESIINYDKHTGTPNQQIIDESIRSYNELKNKKPNYTIEFTFEDGFTCYARNQKNAERKHNNYLKSKNI